MTDRIKLGLAAFGAAFLFSASTGLFFGCSVPEEHFGMTHVEGVVTVRGNVPFNAPILETESRNIYVLVLTPELASELMTPRRYSVTGRLYLGDWNGRPYAHIEVSELTWLQE